MGLFQFNIVLGILVAYFSNYVVGTMQLGGAEWRWKLGVPAIPALFFLAMLFTIPRSPRWLVKRGRIAEAREVLLRTGATDYEAELQDIIVSIDAEHQSNDALFVRKYRFPIFLGGFHRAVQPAFGDQCDSLLPERHFCVCGIQQSVGGFAVGADRGDESGVYDAGNVGDRPDRAQDAAADRIGGHSGMPGGGGRDFFAASQPELAGMAAGGYIAFFAFSQGAVIWVFISEVFPNRVRAKGQSLGSFSHWIMNAAISAAFPHLARESGGYPFVFFAVMMVLQFFVVLFVYPETKGFTLEEMQKKLGIA